MILVFGLNKNTIQYYEETFPSGVAVFLVYHLIAIVILWHA
jgi:hypothetical protein